MLLFHYHFYHLSYTLVVLSTFSCFLLLYFVAHTSAHIYISFYGMPSSSSSRQYSFSFIFRWDSKLSEIFLSVPSCSVKYFDEEIKPYFLMAERLCWCRVSLLWRENLKNEATTTKSSLSQATSTANIPVVLEVW